MLTKREQRIAEEQAARNDMPRRIAEALEAQFRHVFNPVGCKKWFQPFTVFEGEGSLTPYAKKEKARRRRKNREARQSRRRNR